MTAALEVARAYAARGIAVFPVEPNGKRPLTAHGLHDATTTADAIEAWLRRWPSANVGIPTGAGNGLLVVDLDVKRESDGRATLATLEQKHGALPLTLTSATPSGGEHRWFRAPCVLVRNAAGRIGGEPAPGVDIRGDGGYVVAPPSVIDGRLYRWTQRDAPAELPPRWVAALTTRRVIPIHEAPSWEPRSYRDADRVVDWCERALAGEVVKVARAPFGTRNERLYASAHAMGGLVHTGGLASAEIARALMSGCESWPARERDGRKDLETIARGIRDGIARPRTLPELGGGRRVG